MLVRRLLMATAVLLTVGGVLAATVGYGLHIRSDRHRRAMEADLTRFFGMPTTIERIEPHSLSARRLLGIGIRPPGHDERMFDARLAVWDTAGPPKAPGSVLEVYDSELVMGSDVRETEEFLRTLRLNLATRLDQLNISRIHFRNIKLTWPREDVQLVAHGADGEVQFDSAGRGVADLVTYHLNDVRVEEPIRIRARLALTGEHLLPEVALDLPTVPLVGLNLDRVIGASTTQGAFNGRITLRPSAGSTRTEVAFRGALRDVLLEEITHRLPGGPLPGVVNLTVEEALFRDRRPERLLFGGEVRSLDTDALLDRLGWARVGGQMRLSVHRGVFEDGVLRELRADGYWGGGSLDALMQALLDKQGIQGQLHVRLHHLTIEDDQLVSADADLIGHPPQGQMGTISRELLSELVRDYLDLTLPKDLLPAQLPFVHLGARVLINPKSIRILAGEGPAGRALVTVRLLGRDWPLLGETDVLVPLPPLLDEARRQLDDLEETLRRQLDPPPAQP